MPQLRKATARISQDILQGADSLITDDPPRARAGIEAESRLTSLERLLLLGTAFWLGVQPARLQISRDSD